MFRNANPSNLRGSLLENDKDHLLIQARSDLAKQELHVESLGKCIGELQRQTEEQRLALQDAECGFVESRREQVQLQEELSMKEKVLPNTQIRNMHEMGQIQRAQEQRVDEVSMQKLRQNHETIQQLISQLQQMQQPMNSIINLDYRKTFWEINFLRLIHPEIILKEFNLKTCKETEKQSLKQGGWRRVAKVKTNKIKAQFQCRQLRQGR